MKSKTIYMVAVDYGGINNYVEAAFVNEADRNEIALAFAEELEHANLNRNVEAWMSAYPPGPLVWQTAVDYALKEAKDWFYAQHVTTWEVKLYE
jgi:hypothetical protein